jgi:hypothetical protein
VIAFAAGLFLAPTFAARWHRPPPATPGPKSEPPSRIVTLLFNSEPPGAKTLFANHSEMPEQVTPFEMKVLREAFPFEVRMRLDGYRDTYVVVHSDSDRSYQVVLAKKEEPPPPTSKRAGKEDLRFLTP